METTNRAACRRGLAEYLRKVATGKPGTIDPRHVLELMGISDGDFSQTWSAWSEVLLPSGIRKWADYIDPTCTNVGGDRWAFECSACGCRTTEFEHMSIATARDVDALRDAICGAVGIDPRDVRMMPPHTSIPRYCPGCGARVVSGDE